MPKKLLDMRISNMEKIKMKVRKGEYPTLTQTRFYNIIIRMVSAKKCPASFKIFLSNFWAIILDKLCVVRA